MFFPQKWRGGHASALPIRTPGSTIFPQAPQIRPRAISRGCGAVLRRAEEALIACVVPPGGNAGSVDAVHFGVVRADGVEAGDPAGRAAHEAVSVVVGVAIEPCDRAGAVDAVRPRFLGGLRTEARYPAAGAAHEAVNGAAVAVISRNRAVRVDSQGKRGAAALDIKSRD